MLGQGREERSGRYWFGFEPREEIRYAGVSYHSINSYYYYLLCLVLRAMHALLVTLGVHPTKQQEVALQRVHVALLRSARLTDCRCRLRADG